MSAQIHNITHYPTYQRFSVVWGDGGGFRFAFLVHSKIPYHLLCLEHAGSF